MSIDPPTRRIARLLSWLGLILIATGLVLLVLVPMRSPASLMIGSGVAALGLGMLLGGELILGPSPRLFTARGQVVRGDLTVRAGLCDLTLGEGPHDRVATVRFGPFGKPHFRAENGVATLRLINGLRPNLALWEVGLAGNVLWDVDLRSTLGDLTLDLSSLRLERVTARTTLGRLHVRGPLRGYVQVQLCSVAGVIEVNIPPQVAAQVTIHKGTLAAVAMRHGRLQQVEPYCYRTEDYGTAENQIDLHVDCAAGEVLIA